MIRIEKTAVSGFEAAIRGMRNPMNSWGNSDSYFGEQYPETIGENDLDLMKRLAKAGTEHAKYLRYIIVTADLIAPLYWYKEMDCYRAGVEHNSCSTMHKIQAKEFTKEDFSTEHLNAFSRSLLSTTIKALNVYRNNYLTSKTKDDWWQMIQILPSSYNQRRTYLFSYQALAAIYKQRKGHRLDEWNAFCKWIETLPHSEIITGKMVK